MSESKLPRCPEDNVLLGIGQDALGKFLMCPVCHWNEHVGQGVTEADWYRVWSADRASLEPSPREAARQRVKALIELYKKLGQDYPPVKLAELIPDLELLVEEDV